MLVEGIHLGNSYGEEKRTRNDLHQGISTDLVIQNASSVASVAGNCVQILAEGTWFHVVLQAHAEFLPLSLPLSLSLFHAPPAHPHARSEKSSWCRINTFKIYEISRDPQVNNEYFNIADVSANNHNIFLELTLTPYVEARQWSCDNKDSFRAPEGSSTLVTPFPRSHLPCSCKQSDFWSSRCQVAWRSGPIWGWVHLRLH